MSMIILLWQNSIFHKHVSDNIAYVFYVIIVK